MSFSRKMVLVLLAVAAVVSATEMRIGYVDSDRIIGEFPGTQTAEQQLMQFKAQLEQDATNKQERMLQLQQSLESQAMLISPERKLELERELQDSMISYQQYVQTIMAQDGLLMQKQMELMQPVLAQIQVAIEQVSEAENYDLVFDAQVGLVYAKPVYDITEKVIAALNNAQ